MIRKLFPQKSDINDNSNEDRNFFRLGTRKTRGIELDGINDLLLNFGKCCNPIPGDNLIGFVTRGRGVTVHRSRCKSLPLLSNESDR